MTQNNNILKNKIDFVAIIKAEKANPNGDPLNGNRPRTTYAGFGEISDVCIKRKIRNRLQDLGEEIFVKSRESADDGFRSLKERYDAFLKKDKSETLEKEKKLCQKWIDVRSFGQVFAFKGEAVSIGIRGPVSVRIATSCSPVDITSMEITKSVDSVTPTGGKTKSSDTMGTKHYVDFGLYKVMGSINVQLAEKTGFTEEDAEKIKIAILTLFTNDSSSARPEGSMEVVSLYWFRHSSKLGQYPSLRVHNSVDIKLKDGVISPRSTDDYIISLNALDNLEPEVIVPGPMSTEELLGEYYV